MKVAKIQRGGRVASAIIRGDRVHVVGRWYEEAAMAAPFDAPRLSLSQLEEIADSAGETLPLDQVGLLMPSEPLTKLVCLGLNYKNHVDETHNDLPPNPALFTKVADSLVPHGEAVLRPKVSEQFDYEGEICVVIGKGGRHISRETALDHVFGYTIMLDGSVRDYQKHSVSAGKNFWRSGALGPWIVTADEIPDPSVMKLETRLNGETVQSTTADLMLYDIPTAISYVSQWTPLAPGDVIATGTPGGVGARRKPPLWMKAGDVIEVDVSPIGVLSNPVGSEH